MFCVRLFDEQCFEVDSRHHRHRGRGRAVPPRLGAIFNGFFFVATCAGLLLVAARWLVDQLGGGTGGCGGAAARRLTSGGLRRVPALFPVDLAALCGSLERLVLATPCCKKVPCVERSFLENPACLTRANMPLDRAHCGLSNGIGVSGGHV